MSAKGMLNMRSQISTLFNEVSQNVHINVPVLDDKNILQNIACHRLCNECFNTVL